MEPQKEKDALTDLTEISESDISNSSESNGEVTDSSGDKVTLDFHILAQKLIDSVRRKGK
jgi:hypothetical protein